MNHLGESQLGINVSLRPTLFVLDIDWIATEMRPLTNETFVVFDDKVRKLIEGETLIVKIPVFRLPTVVWSCLPARKG